MGCGYSSYKAWAIEQTYGNVPCATITEGDVLDSTDVPALESAPLDAWFVVCNRKAYLCTYRYDETSGWSWGVGVTVGTVTENRICQLLKDEDIPPEAAARLAQPK